MQAYAIVVDGDGKVTENVLGDHAAGIVLKTNLTLVRHSVSGGKRTVVVTRALKGLTPRHHDFDAQQLSLDFIGAVGSTPAFGYHKAKTVGTLALWPQAPASHPAGGDVNCSGPASFPVNASNVQCKSLSAVSAATERACADACCARGENACNTWQLSADKGCWVGLAGVGPSSLFASQSLRRALSTPQDNPGSLHRRGERT